MKVEFIDNDLKVPYMVDDMLARKCHKLERMLHRFSTESLLLKCALDLASSKKAYLVKLNLTIPNATLNASAVHKSIVSALGLSFNKLFGSVTELKTTLRAQHETIEKTDEAQHILENVPMVIDSRKMLSELFAAKYGQFYNYALREIRFRSYQGYTKPGTVEVADILDEALLVVAKEFNVNFNEEKAVRLLYKEIKKAIDRHLNPGGIALTPVEEAIEPENIDSSYGEYYLPDETIRVEDILIDADSILPEQEVEYKEIETHIDKLLAQLPADWREAFILSIREELPISDIASNRGKSINEIQDDIESARAFIREKLKDAGFHWKE
jgi:RNA polymerase sigma factor (sigma-70 family)